MTTTREATATGRRLGAAALAVLAAASLAGCAGKDRMTTGSVSRDSSRSMATRLCASSGARRPISSGAAVARPAGAMP